MRPRTSQETDNPLGRNWLSTIKRLCYGLLVGAAVASLPWLARKVDNVALLLTGEILGWAGAILALALGGWNARPFTVMTFENVLLEKKNSIAYVTVNRPKVLNALSLATMEELGVAFQEIKNDSTIRVAILTGAGEKAFVAGADIGELAKQDAVSGKEYAHRGQAVLDLIENLGKPVIACINGFALGGGCELALACTMRLASDNAKLGQPEVKLGIIPGYGGSQRLSRLVGKGLAMQMVLAGEMITAQEAHRIGLVNEVTAAAELIPRAEAIAAKIIANAPLAVQYAMEAVNKGMEMTLAEGLYLEATLFGVCCATEDKAEGTAAFLEKRAAQFKGK